MTDADDDAATSGRAGGARPAIDRVSRVAAPLLAAEFAVLYVAVPLALAFALPADWMWPMLSGATLVGLALLHLTPGFSWRELARPLPLREAALAAAFGLGVLALAALLCRALWPELLFQLAARRPGLLILILALYPLLSALPQELFFRVLFFRRYGALFPDRRVALLVNAAVFSLAHLFFWNWVAVSFTFVGGLIFAWAYRDRGGFMMALALHAVAGDALFVSGLGIFFYHGAAPQ